jgi:hypothetical protein
MKTVEEWSSVYSLASEWQFESIAKIATNRLTKIATPIEKIVLARKYQDLEHWLKEALVNICGRRELLNSKEWQVLDKDDVGRIGRVREKFAQVKSNIAELVEMEFDLEPSLAPLRTHQLKIFPSHNSSDSSSESD